MNKKTCLAFIRNLGFTVTFLLTISSLAAQSANKPAQKSPNIIFIYTDDLGYGDLSCYGATKIKTPHIDQLAAKGLRFTNAHTTSATCTPSRYALMTGQYPWRKNGTGVLPGDAALIVPTDKSSLPKILRTAGYRTAIVGKWHLGLGNEINKDWNAEVKPGPNEVGFDYSFIFPATADRVPTVFLENHHVVAADATDPIKVDYKKPVGNDPTGKEHPELLKMQASPGQGHNQTIVNGIGRIGFMEGGRQARWTDEELPLTFLAKAKEFIETNQQQPFFLYYALTEPHVPRMPSTMFKGKSGLGYRGDAILQLDWTVGEIIKQLKQLGLYNNTILIFSSDNGPVLDDGYVDGAVSQLNGHTPAGLLRGGKYSIFEAGTRVPFIISWPKTIKPGTSAALVSQIDFIASFAKLTGQKIPVGEAIDSEDQLNAFLGKTQQGRATLVEHAGTLAIISGDWKYIHPSNGVAYYKLTDTETGNSPEPQLYNLKKDIGEKENLAAQYPEKIKEMQQLLEAIKNKQ
jgi:arylsulfatase A-like enzyme